jgi:SAM-dependent methyltransferase
LTSNEKSQVQAATIRDFGKQWQWFPEVDGWVAENELFESICPPFISAADIRGKSVAEIGSGNGPIVRQLLAAGASRVVALEPSAAFNNLQKNFSDADRLTLLRTTGDTLPADLTLDFVFSIGVIHHIPEPDPTIDAAWNALKPGERILIWIYAEEGNLGYLRIARPIRVLTSRTPFPFLVGLSWLLLPFLRAYIWSCGRWRLPMGLYMKNVLGNLSSSQLRITIVDQLNPTYAKYYLRAEARNLLERAGFINVRLQHREGYSWTVYGQKPE